MKPSDYLMYTNEVKRLMQSQLFVKLTCANLFQIELCMNSVLICYWSYNNRPFSKMAAENSNTLELTKIENEYQH